MIRPILSALILVLVATVEVTGEKLPDSAGRGAKGGLEVMEAEIHEPVAAP